MGDSCLTVRVRSEISSPTPEIWVAPQWIVRTERVRVLSCQTQSGVRTGKSSCSVRRRSGHRRQSLQQTLPLCPIAPSCCGPRKTGTRVSCRCKIMYSAHTPKPDGYPVLGCRSSNEPLGAHDSNGHISLEDVLRRQSTSRERHLAQFVLPQECAPKTDDGDERQLHALVPPAADLARPLVSGFRVG